MTEIMKTEVQMNLEKMSNWKASGPDQVQVFWIKHLTVLHERFSMQLQDLINCPEGISKWLATGENVLIKKDEANGTDSSHYRPIACLPTM